MTKSVQFVQVCRRFYRSAVLVCFDRREIINRRQKYVHIDFPQFAHRTLNTDRSRVSGVKQLRWVIRPTGAHWPPAHAAGSNALLLDPSHSCSLVQRAQSPVAKLSVASCAIESLGISPTRLPRRLLEEWSTRALPMLSPRGRSIGMHPHKLFNMTTPLPHLIPPIQRLTKASVAVFAG